MSRTVAGPEIERLIQLLAKLPGLGPRSARRAALHLVKKREQLLGPLSEANRRRLSDRADRLGEPSANALDSGDERRGHGAEAGREDTELA